MKKFKYKAEAYLRFLKHQREMALKDVHSAKSLVDELKTSFEFMEKERLNAFRVNSQFGQGLTDLNRVNDNNHYIRMIKVRLEDLSQEIARAEDHYQRQYQKLLDVQMQIKKIESHREKLEEDHRVEYNKKSQKVTDEINSNRRREKNAKSL